MSELVTAPAEAAAVARIHELRAAGASVRVIAATLTAEGHHPALGGCQATTQP